ncbi:hypothetical protein BJX63DRAFT_307106 [Aspergillus granulosus]|uniref:Secreted protein n=1 Tax=Aspergillus granulosus TaxID=176169 RepID=A0ABR4H790_9EURO
MNVKRSPHGSSCATMLVLVISVFLRASSPYPNCEDAGKERLSGKLSKQTGKDDLSSLVPQGMGLAKVEWKHKVFVFVKIHQ